MPQAAFFGEEDTSNNVRDMQREYIFYVDPIDGTINFMFDYFHSSISVALAQNGTYGAIIGKAYYIGAIDLYGKRLGKTT